jgi:predicted RNase H-like HicB family nuclease
MKRIQNQVIYFSANALRKLGYRFNEEHDERISEMQHAIGALDNHTILFKIDQSPDGTWSAESTNISGIMTGGKDPREVPAMIKDAVFTYFEIPPHLAKDELLRSDNEPASVVQRVHVGA